MSKHNKVCSLCHQSFKPKTNKKHYIIKDYGLRLRIHPKCWQKVKTEAKKKRWTFDKMMYSMALGIYRG